MQLDLLGGASPAQPTHTLARRTDPGTSHAAAKPKPCRGTHYARILSAMDLRRPLGAEQIGALARLPAHEVRRRMPELQRAGMVELAEGERETVYGRRERLWKAAA